MSDERVEIEPAATRRRLFAGAGMAGAAAVLAACGTEPDSGFEVPTPGNSDPSSPAGPESPASDAGQDALAAVDDVPIGGGLILEEQDVVITRPADSEWYAFSATCTHQGCTVAEVRSDVIFCACHNSQYSVRDGSVVQEADGVAPGTQDALPAVDIEVDGGSVLRA
jgi:Rieske Fe-S protein